jgi:hypothetical protein
VTGGKIEDRGGVSWKQEDKRAMRQEEGVAGGRRIRKL